MPDQDRIIREYFQAFTGPQKDACLLLDPAGVILAANQAALQMLGPGPGRGGTNIADCCEDKGEAVSRYLENCSRTSSPVPGSLTWRTAAGTKLKTPCRGFRLSLPAAPRNDLIVIQASPEERNANRFIVLNRTMEELRASRHELLRKSQRLEQEVEERRRAEAVLKASHARLTSILNSIEAVVYVADMATYEVLFINHYGRELLGDVTGRVCWQSLQVNQTGPCPFCTNRYLLDDHGQPGAPHVWEFQNTKTHRWFHIIDRAIRWVDDRIVRIEIATDITARREAGERIRQDEERAAALLNLSQLAWTSRDDLAHHALKEAVRLTGSKIGYLHFMPPDQQTIEFSNRPNTAGRECAAAPEMHARPREAGLWADSARLRRPVVHNDYPPEPDGGGNPGGHSAAQRHMSVPVFEGEEIVAICGVGDKDAPYDEADIRQLTLYMGRVWCILRQKQNDMAVRQAKEEWEQTFHAIDEAVFIHDAHMTVVRANLAAGRLFGVAPEKLIGRRCHELFRQEPTPCDGCPELLARADRQPHTREIRHPNLDKIFAVSSSPIPDERSGINGFVYIAKDITDQTALQEQLRQAQKMEAVGTLAGGIAHDFNNILSPIIGFTELTMEQLGSAHPTAADLTEVLRAAQRAKELVKQILTFSRQSSHERKPLQIHLVIREALKLLRATLPTSIEIRQQIPADCGTVLADPTEIHQIVMNLCTNAYHAMRTSDAGVLHVHLSRLALDESDTKTSVLGLAPGPFIRLTVSDTGCGMDHATQEKIFEPYFTTKPQGEGTGMGLAMVHGIVKSCGGHITVHSEPDKGALFHLYFPAILESLPAEEGGLDPALPAGQNEHILVVDDERAIMELNRQILLMLGYRVTGFTSSEEALRAIRADAPAFDLLLTDMAMPKINGLDLIREAQQRRPTLPVILCTGFSERINDGSVHRLGIHGYLLKPMLIKDLAVAVREALDTKPARPGATTSS